MTLTRRTLLSIPVAVPFLNLAGHTAVGDDLYFPPSDAQGGWRRLDEPSEILTIAGIDKSRLDQAFQYTQTTSQHGGLLVTRHGYLVYEKYFGRANREANPNMYSIGKMFTSACCGIMLSEHRDRFPDGLSQKVFTKEFLPAAFPLSYPEMADIQLGNLLTMTSGIQDSHNPAPGAPTTGAQTGIVHGENVSIPYWTSPNPVLDQDGSTLHGKMWAKPGEGYLYDLDPHVASIVLRGVVGMELQQYIQKKLAEPMGWGTWGYALHHNGTTLEHTPGAAGIALHSTDALRFGYLLLQQGKWKNQQLIPQKYIAQLSKPSPFN